MSDQIERYLEKHVDRAVDLYLLASDLLDCRSASGSAMYARGGSDADELAVLMRLKRLLERIRLGSEQCCFYSTPLSEPKASS